MKKLLLLTICSMSVLLQQCTQQTDTPVASTVVKTRSVEIAIATPDDFVTIAGLAEVTVYAGDTILCQSKLDILPNKITGTVEKVPLGRNRLFVVSVYDNNSSLIYEGSDSSDVNSGKTYVTILLRKITDGTVIINGKIDDVSFYPPITIEHNITGVERNLETQTVEAWIVAWVTISMDFTTPLEYQWTIDGLSEVDTVTWSLESLHQKCILPWDGIVTVNFYARYQLHPEIMEVKTFDIEVKNGNPTDLDNPAPEGWSIDTVKYELGPEDTFSINLTSTHDTIQIQAHGTWCMQPEMCMSPAGDCELDNSMFEVPQFCGGALLAQYGENVISVGEFANIFNPSGSKSITFSANRLLEPYKTGNAPGKITVFVVHSGLHNVK